MMPTVLGKIPVRKDGIFSALWGIPESWTCAWCCGAYDELGMRTDNAQDCLTPFP